jgi:glycosyltransferase involved in cell wall biosynthesis
VSKFLRRAFGVRLGNFTHYPARPLALPNRYRGAARLDCTPRISIVTPVYNQADYIEASVQSVLSQNYPNLQYIVMDGGSTDGTWEIIERFRPSLSHAYSGPDGGQAAAINAGMRKADGEILAWLNGDDMLLPGALAYVAAFFEANADVDAVYGHRIVIDEKGLDIGRWVLPPHDGAILSWMDFIPQETLFLRRSAFEKVGFQLDESFRFALDWDLLLRMREAGVRFSRLPRYLGAFRVHLAQKTSAAWLQDGILETARLLERYHGRVPTMHERRRHVLPYIAKHLILQWADTLLHLY